MVRVLDLYCGMGGLSLGFALALKGAEIAGLDIDGDAADTYNLNLERFGAGAYVQDVLRWEPAGAYDIVIGGPPCFPPDTPVVVNDAVLVSISELREGERAVTHEGRAMSVTEVFRRPYKGKLVSLRVALLKIPIRVTPNHPFLAYRPKPCYAGDPKPCTPACLGGLSRISKVARGGKVYEYIRSCKRREGEIGWVEAGNLRPSRDFVALKIPQMEPPPDVPEDPELWYLFGLYVADGSAHVHVRRRGHRVSKRDYVVFYLGRHEHDLIERVKAIAVRKGWKCNINCDRSVARVYIWSTDLHHLVLGLFGKHADKKRVPLWVFGLPRECRASFLQGIRDGDGDRENFVTTVNPVIAFVAWLLALSLGMPASLSRVAMKPKTSIEGRTANQSPYLYKVREVKRKDHIKAGRFFSSEGYVWLGVIRAEWEDYEGEVFNLEVEKDHSYLAWGVVVHNCQPFSTANVRNPGEAHPLFPTFPRFFDVVLALRPKLFLLENVKGLATRRHRDHLERQLARVAGDYVVEWRVLDAADYGVPQRRERLIVVGVRRDLGARPLFPEPTHSEAGSARLGGGRLHRWLTLGEAIGDLLLVPPQEGKKLIQTNPRHGKPADIDKPSRTVKVDGRGGDFAFDTILVPAEEPRPVALREEQAERIRKEREDAGRHWGTMEFPDRLDRPSRTVSSHTVEGTKRETTVIPFIDRDGNLAYIPWTEYQSKHPILDPGKPAATISSHLAKSSRDALVPVPDHVMTEGGGWDNPRSDWGSRVMDPGKPACTLTEKHRSGQLVPVPPTTAEAVGRPSPSLVAGARVYAAGRAEHGSDAEKVCYRRLTVREAMRIQSFPDWWRFPERVSVSKRYRLVGEAVPPILAYRLAAAVARTLGLETREPPRREEWRLPYFERAFADYLGGGGRT
jgi:site-specific DNA-cytosine methylase/intein/homing endonuclease